MTKAHNSPWRIWGWTRAQADAMSRLEVDAFDDPPYLCGLAPGRDARAAMALLWDTSAMARVCCMFHVACGDAEGTFLAKNFDPERVSDLAITVG